MLSPHLEPYNKVKSSSDLKQKEMSGSSSAVPFISSFRVIQKVKRQGGDATVGDKFLPKTQ
jgi:hypothetical protein